MACPFCGAKDPFEYVNVGLGLEPVGVTCCRLGYLYFDVGRPIEEVKRISAEMEAAEQTAEPMEPDDEPQIGEIPF